MIKSYPINPNKPSGFLVYNDGIGKDIVESIEDLIRPSIIIVAYSYNPDTLLIRTATYYGRKGVASAIQQMIKLLESDDKRFEKSDAKFQEELGDPNFSTKEVLVGFLREELKALKK